MYVNLENKSLSELIELKKQLAGTNKYYAVDRIFKIETFIPYNKMIVHCEKRSLSKVKKFR
jgi:hypothetical protein